MKLATLVSIALVAPFARAQSPCLDQSYVPNPVTNGLEITQNQWVTQTFTVGRAGQLTQVDVVGINHHRGTPTFPLEVRIVSTDPAGVPNGPSLATFTFQPNQVPATRGRLPIDLTAAGIQVTVGQALGIRLSSQAAPSTQTYAWWGEAPSSGYANGQIWLRDTTALSVWDLGFETFVAVSASSRAYGQGHPGTTGTPSLTPSANPVLGTTIDLIVGNSLGTQTTAALFAGIAAASQPTPFGGTLLVQILADFTLTLPAAGARVPQPIPNDPRLCGRSVFFQSAQLDAGASHGIAFSPGLELVLGS
jgi:hypothetical protein